MGSEPRVQTYEDGNKVARVNVAVTVGTEDDGKGGRKPKTQWYTLVARRKLAEQLERFGQKGIRVAAEGNQTLDSYIGKDGVERTVNTVEVNYLRFLTYPPREEGATPAHTAPASSTITARSGSRSNLAKSVAHEYDEMEDFLNG
jgi:single stranded DNA-binding protein